MIYVLIDYTIRYFFYGGDNKKKWGERFNQEINALSKQIDKEYQRIKAERLKGIIKDQKRVEERRQEQEYLLNQQIEEWRNYLSELENKYREEIKEKRNKVNKQIEEMNKELLDKKGDITKKIAAEESSYNEIVQDFRNKKIEIENNYNNDIATLKEVVNEKRKEIQNLIKQFKEDEEARKEKDFYRIELSLAAKDDIEKLKTVAAQLNNPTTLCKLIWKEYIENAFNRMCGRVLGSNSDKGGIYKITNIKNQMVYIGQTVHFKNRFRQHCKRGIHADTITNNKLYEAMWEEGIDNFTFQIVEICSNEKLTEREKFYINFYDSKNYGYNCKT